MGAEIPDGVLAFKSKHDPLPLSEIEQLLLLSYMGGVTGWHFAIMRHERYAPKLSNYSASPMGRTFPSAAGFITSELFLLMIREHTFFLHVIFTLRLRFMMAK